MGQLSKCNADLRISHFKAAKQVICYLKSIIYLVLKYRSTFSLDRQTNLLSIFLPYRLMNYTNTNYASNPKDHKSVIKNCFYVNGAIVS